MVELRPGNPIVAGEVIILPIERSTIHSFSGNMGCWLSGLKEPFAVIVCDASGISAFDPQGMEISVASLIRKIPDLSAGLASATQRRGWSVEFPGDSA